MLIILLILFSLLPLSTLSENYSVTPSIWPSRLYFDESMLNRLMVHSGIHTTIQDDCIKVASYNKNPVETFTVSTGFFYSDTYIILSGCRCYSFIADRIQVNPYRSFIQPLMPLSSGGGLVPIGPITVPPSLSFLKTSYALASLSI